MLVWPLRTEESHAHFPARDLEPFTGREGEAHRSTNWFETFLSKARGGIPLRAGAGSLWLYILLTRGDIDPGLSSAHITDKYQGIKVSSYQLTPLILSRKCMAKGQQIKESLAGIRVVYTNSDPLRRGCCIDHNLGSLCLRNMTCFVTESV